METTNRKVGLDQFLFRLLGFRFAAVNERQRPLQFGQTDFARFFDILQLGPARPQFLPRFRRHVAFRHVHAALQPPRFAFQRLQPLDRPAHLVDQPLLLERIEIDPANLDRNLDARPRHAHFALHVRLLLPFRRFLELLGLLQRQIVKLRDLVDVLQRLLRLVRDFLFGQLFVVELHDLFDRPRALPQILSNRNQLLNHDRRPRDGLHHHELPAFDALRDGHFAFARQQRHRAHLAQIHPHRIVCLFERARRQIQIAAAFVRMRLVLHRRIVVAATPRTLRPPARLSPTPGLRKSRFRFVQRL